MHAATFESGRAATLNRNLANILTSLRLALALPVAALILMSSTPSLLLAALLFGVAGFTDFVDGRVARGRGHVSALGCFLDPLADKCVIDAAVAALTLAHAFPVPLALLLIGRDLVITALRLARRTRPALLAPGRMAKLKTLGLYVGIGGLIAARVAGNPALFVSWLLVDISWLLVVGAALLSIASAVQYLRRTVVALPARRIPR